VTPDDYRARALAIEARANLLRGHEIARRTGNGGRYWFLGAAIAEMQAARAIAGIEARMNAEMEALAVEFYAM
jgi:hypothetical protein